MTEEKNTNRISYGSYLEDKLINLEAFRTKQAIISQNNIVDWVAECNVFFNALGLERGLINNFNDLIDLKTASLPGGGDGAFMMLGHVFKWNWMNSKLYHIDLIFKVAKYKIKEKREEKAAHLLYFTVKKPCIHRW